MKAHNLHDHPNGGDSARSESGHSHIDASVRRSALWIALVLNGSFLVVEVVAGFITGSLALLADGVHMLSDVVALSFAIGASALASRPATARHSYGFGRAELIAAQVNAITLLVAAAWITFEAVQRLSSPADIRGGGVVVVAGIGLLVNVVSAVILARAAGNNLNMRGAYLHMVVDALGSVAAIGAGIGIVVWSAQWLDPVASMLVALFTVVGAWRLLRRATNVLLDATPEHLNAHEVAAAILHVPTVTAVHHVHLWNIASEKCAFSAHVVLNEEQSLHDAQSVAKAIKDLLAHDFGIAHTTLELECHACDAEELSLEHAAVSLADGVDQNFPACR